jgi:glycosyltransferase involved in cell wall biosynthesis
MHRIFVLSPVYDQHYLSVRKEEISKSPLQTLPKRLNLYHCLQQATQYELFILSFPPKALKRRSPRWLPPQTVRLGDFVQRFCPSLDAPKLRILLAFIFYPLHILSSVRRGDILVLDNYEITSVLAAWLCRFFHGTRVILDFEDGRHLIDRGWQLIFYRLAELLGRPLINGAILAHPLLGTRLRPRTPTIVIPGFYSASESKGRPPFNDVVRFIYAGTLDSVRGVDLLLEVIPCLPTSGWRLDITGSGPLEPNVREVASSPSNADRVFYHSILSEKDHSLLLHQSHVGLNLQISADPISTVTFPSKIFSYLSAGLLVLSTKASSVQDELKDACLYFDEENGDGFANTMTRIICSPESVAPHSPKKDFGLSATTERLKIFLASFPL